MQKLFILFLLASTYLLANLNVIVSIVPVQTFLKSIGGEKVDITLMVQPGSSPHTYEPKPSQMMAISKTDLYLAIDVEFEDVWLPKFKNLNAKMHVVNIADGINKLHMKPNSHKCTSHQEHAHEHEGNDPHIWTTPQNVKIIAKNIYKALVQLDAKNEGYYLHNLNLFLETVRKTDIEIKKSLSLLKGNRTFMVFHPSWGYFAKAYHLKQIAVEVEGKSPKPKELVHLIKEAKEEQVKAIFTQPEFSDASAKIIAKSLNIPVVKVSPMAADWSQNLINMAKTIAGQTE